VDLGKSGIFGQYIWQQKLDDMCIRLDTVRPRATKFGKEAHLGEAYFCRVSAVRYVIYPMNLAPELPQILDLLHKSACCDKQQPVFFMIDKPDEMPGGPPSALTKIFL